MIFHAFLIKYAEIAIKGKNRYIFEDALVKQMNIALSKVEGEFEVKKEQGRIYVFCPEQYDYDETVDALQHVFGIVGICPVVIYEEQGFEQMAKDVVSYMKNCHPNYNGTFKVYTRRAKKSYPITSMEVSAELGGRILDEFPDASVDVHDPELMLSVEIRDKIYVYSQTIKGAGGMPIGTNGKAMLLLSGGIDSPVAGYMIAKRGVKIDAVYFHAPPYTSESASPRWSSGAFLPGKNRRTSNFSALRRPGTGRSGRCRSFRRQSPRRGRPAGPFPLPRRPPAAPAAFPPSAPRTPAGTNDVPAA